MHASHSIKDIPDRIDSGFQIVGQGHDVEGNELEQGTKSVAEGDKSTTATQLMPQDCPVPRNILVGIMTVMGNWPRVRRVTAAEAYRGPGKDSNECTAVYFILTGLLL